MGVSGYNAPDSRTWHQDQRCSSTLFPAATQMDSKVAENRGLSPCGNCCGGEWPHADETADRDPEEWIDKIEPGETALVFNSRTWKGEEYVGRTEDGTFIRWPKGLDYNVNTTREGQVVSDLEDPDIEVETVEWDETPLTEWEGEDE